MDITPGLVVDGLMVLLIIGSILAGWRQGAYGSILSTIGVVAGLLCGVFLAPLVMSVTEAVALRLMLAMGIIIMLTGVGNLIGAAIGSRLRERMKWKSSIVIDSSVGVVFQVIASLFVAWLIAIPLAAGGGSTVAEGIKASKILGAVDAVAPDSLETLPAKMSAMLSDSGLPLLISPFNVPENQAVAAPAVRIEDTALVERLRPSVVHVMGESQSCSRRLMGSGFVASQDHVITNAHVVAGAEAVSLDTMVGTFTAEVVYYNPDIDIAVLYAPGTNIAPLQWAAQPAESGDDAVVMGFPASGPFEAAPARISDLLTISGPNIYASSRVEREAYTVRGSIRQGNSGGPLLNPQGEVIGVVFGAAVDNSDIGYALSTQEVLDTVGDWTTMTEPVNTQACVNR